MVRKMGNYVTRCFVTGFFMQSQNLSSQEVITLYMAIATVQEVNEWVKGSFLPLFKAGCLSPSCAFQTDRAVLREGLVLTI